MRYQIVGLSLVFAMGCEAPVQMFQELPTTAVARSMPGPERPKLLDSRTAPWEELPDMVPVGLFNTTRVSASREWHVHDLWHRSTNVNLRADVFCVEDAGREYAGSLGTSYGFGISSSTAVYANNMTGYLLKLSPVWLGYRVNESGMVTWIAKEGPAAKAGLLEGDTLLSINDRSVIAGRDAVRSPHLIQLLTSKSGDPALLVWVRPGSGRMHGTTTFAGCSEGALGRMTSLPDAVPWRSRVDTDTGF